MENVVLAVLSLVLLVPILFLLQLGITAKGKISILILALLISFISEAAGKTFNLLLAFPVLIILVFLSVYIMDNRLASALYKKGLSQKNLDNEIHIDFQPLPIKAIIEVSTYEREAIKEGERVILLDSALEKSESIQAKETVQLTEDSLEDLSFLFNRSIEQDEKGKVPDQSTKNESKQEAALSPEVWARMEELEVLITYSSSPALQEAAAGKQEPSFEWETLEPLDEKNVR
ncbi:hypothetical protein [Neobacillus terrae]|uniref:hypothetical protein n=1 Tax=Neobacillus terrae TaxID=3034837 RepID=UPI00140B7305|nr:hypothetical protein [Neobacillus terrae]NHM30485.1 hypothetical protein [Neobacillus terrae]